MKNGFRPERVPVRNPVLYSEYIDKECIIAIPKDCDLVAVHFYVAKGDVEIFFDSVNNLPSLKLYPDARWNQRVASSVIQQLHIKAYKERNFGVWVIMERV